MSNNDSEPKPAVKIAHVNSKTAGSEKSTPASAELEQKPPLVGGWLKTRTLAWQWIAGHTQWIVKNWNWSKLKPVIRCAVVAWVAVVLFVIPKVEVFFGQVCRMRPPPAPLCFSFGIDSKLNKFYIKASFLILISVFLAPPSDPFISVLEREILVLLFVTIAWA